MMQQIIKKIDNRYIVWFGQSNRWVQFEEPAWYVSKLYQKGLDNYSISIRFAKKYHIDKCECLHFVTKICTGIDSFHETSSDYVVDNTARDLIGNYTSGVYSSRYYLYGGKRIAIGYYSRLAEYYIHPSIAHLEKDHFTGISDIKFEIIDFGTNQVLRINGNEAGAYFFKDFNRLRKRLFIEIANAIYDKTTNDWISFVHASALTDGKKTVLLSSESGSGKSTMAALLQTKGLQVVSDDFVPIDIKFKRAFPFPAAISVKQGALSFLGTYYGNLHATDHNSYEYGSKSIRYLGLNASAISGIAAKPVKNIVFINYNPNVSCDFKKVSATDSFKLFHEQSWVSRNPKHARSFINWFVKLGCYRLEYGDTEKAMNKIIEIFRVVNES
jgi:hypothetical protein